MAVTNAVPIDEVRAAFIEIEPLLREVSEQAFCHWHPVDVYMSLASGQSTLHWVCEGSERTAFVVLTPDAENVHVWIAKAFDGSLDCLAYCDSTLADMVRSFGYKRMTFRTSRPGWKRVAPKLGWKEAMTVYEKEL